MSPHKMNDSHSRMHSGDWNQKFSFEIKCLICAKQNTKVVYESTNAGEAYCSQCGCPYQMTGGSREQRAEGRHPYCNLRNDFIPIARQFWRETRQFVLYAAASEFQKKEGRAELAAWLKKNYKEAFDGL